MIGVFIGNVRIGTVAKFAGEPPATRWFAFAPDDRKQGFPTRKQAVEWLTALHSPHLQHAPDDSDKQRR